MLLKVCRQALFGQSTALASRARLPPLVRGHPLEASALCLVYYTSFCADRLGSMNYFQACVMSSNLCLSFLALFFEYQVISSHTCTNQCSVQDSTGPSRDLPGCPLCGLRKSSSALSLQARAHALFGLHPLDSSQGATGSPGVPSPWGRHPPLPMSPDSKPAPSLLPGCCFRREGQSNCYCSSLARVEVYHFLL